MREREWPNRDGMCRHKRQFPVWSYGLSYKDRKTSRGSWPEPRWSLVGASVWSSLWSIPCQILLGSRSQSLNITCLFLITSSPPCTPAPTLVAILFLCLKRIVIRRWFSCSCIAQPFIHLRRDRDRDRRRQRRGDGDFHFQKELWSNKYKQSGRESGRDRVGIA